MRPMVFSGCLERETVERIDMLRQAGMPGPDVPLD